MADSTLANLIRSLDQAFGHRSWHGTNLRGALRGVRATDAAWRPGPGRHNVWELAVHAAYWKYRVYRLLSDAAPRSFELKGSNFFPRPDGAGAVDDAWAAEVALLETWHRRLRDAVASLDARRLGDHPGKSEHSYFDLVAGAAAHDLYHAGQIQLIKRLRAG